MNAKVLQTFMGDASITVTLDICAHLMPGGEAEAAALDWRTGWRNGTGY